MAFTTLVFLWIIYALTHYMYLCPMWLLSSTLFQLHTHEVVEVCAKILYQVELQRGKTEHMWGFSVEAELIENADRQDELCCYVSRVEDKSVAMQNGNYQLVSLFSFCDHANSFVSFVCVCLFIRFIFLQILWSGKILKLHKTVAPAYE